MVCGRCGFPAKCRWFLSERHYRAWIQETVEPARLNWQRQELERQKVAAGSQPQQDAEAAKAALEEARRLREEAEAIRAKAEEELARAKKENGEDKQA